MVAATSGPIPIPTALKRLHGTRKDRINDDEPDVGADEPELPYLATQEVCDIWEFTLTQLRRMKLAAQVDRDILFGYCQAVYIHRQASKAIEDEGILIPGQLGPLVKHPALQVQRDAASLMTASG